MRYKIAECVTEYEPHYEMLRRKMEPYRTAGEGEPDIRLTLTKQFCEDVALCGGAGAFLMPLAIRNHADVFITGEIKYHDYFGHDTDILLAEIGHYESEQ